MDNDALRSVRNAFYLGFYTNCINEAKQVMSSHATGDDVKRWASVYYHRAVAALKPADAITAISATPAASAALQAVRALAMWHSARNDDEKEMVVEQVREWMGDDALKQEKMGQIAWCRLQIAAGNLREALKVVINDNDNLEKLSLCVSIYIRLDRLDLAAKTVKAMADVDDDDVLTVLATAHLNLAQGGEKIGDAASGLQELIEKFGPSVVVLNTLAVCEMHSKNWAAAFQFLKQARETATQYSIPIAAETLVNVIVCLQQLRKPAEIIAKIEAELSSLYPAHAYLVKKKEGEEAFAKYAATYAFKQ